MSTRDAVNRLRSELKRDKKFYDTYHSTIFMSIHDEATSMKLKMPKKKLVELCKGSATRFLNLLIE